MIYLVFFAFNDNLLEHNHVYTSLICSLAFSCNFVRFECDVYVASRACVGAPGTLD